MMKENNLQYKNKNGWEELAGTSKDEIFSYCEGYKAFLNQGKTERECVKYAVRRLQECGFVALDTQKGLQPGDKVYRINRGKGVFAAVIGTDPLENGIRLVGSHIDSPRIDLKQNPLYEDKSLALFKTHYYGGIKKYQWTTIPLSMHGVIVTQDGRSIEVCVGEQPGENVFCITDLLPHLAQKQMTGKATDIVKGEDLNILVGSMPLADTEEKEKIKQNILQILFERYKIMEEDFLSAEIEFVPAFMSADIGFDRSLIGGYGQDDRVCSFGALSAILDLKNPKKTAITLLVDKEEIGSMGNTGMQSKFFEYCMEDLCESLGGRLRKVLTNSACLSGDVGDAVDPTWADVNELKNASFVNHGILMSKFTGSRGKSGSSDASAEYVAKVRRLMNENNVEWQTGELGKVDAGGGGTVAQFIANLNVDVVDMGTPVLSMHSPFEVTGKLDVYMTYKAYRVFFEVDQF